MRHRTVQVREGEYLGPVDWSYDFAAHGWDRSGGAMNPIILLERVETLRRLESGEWEATTDGGWPRVGWGKVLRVGMYDGWPHWKPVPSVFIGGALNGGWHPWYSITEARSLDKQPGERAGEG